MNILLIGYGRMGKLIEQTAQAAGDRVVCAMDLDNLDQLAAMDKTADVILDFSNPSAFALVEAYVRRTGTPPAFRHHGLQCRPARPPARPGGLCPGAA